MAHQCGVRPKHRQPDLARVQLQPYRSETSSSRGSVVHRQGRDIRDTTTERFLSLGLDLSFTGRGPHGTGTEPGFTATHRQ
jgi:hypothetical protein